MQNTHTRYYRGRLLQPCNGGTLMGSHHALVPLTCSHQLLRYLLSKRSPMCRLRELLGGPKG